MPLQHKSYGVCKLTSIAVNDGLSYAHFSLYLQPLTRKLNIDSVVSKSVILLLNELTFNQMTLLTIVGFVVLWGVFYGS